MHHLKAFSPPTLETMASHYRQRAYHEAREAVREVRWGDYVRAGWRIGRAQTAVSVLYDLGDVRSYQTSQSIDRVHRIVRQYEETP